MLKLSKFRLPFREDSLFGILFLAALLIPLGFSVYNYESFEIFKFGLLFLLTGFAFFVLSTRLRADGGRGLLVLRSTKSFFCILAVFLFWLFLSSLFALDRNYSFFGFYSRFTSGFLFYFIWVGLFFLLSVLDREKILFLLKVLFFCSLATAFWGLLQSIGFGYYIGPTVDFFSRSAPSFLGNPNFSAMFVAAIVPVGIYFWYVSKNFWAKAYFGVSIFLQIWAVIIFASRGALLALIFGLVVSLALSLIFNRQIHKIFTLGILTSLCLMFFLNWAFLNLARPGTLASAFSQKESNVNYRLSVWSLSLQAIVDKPILGYGLGNFELVFEKYRGMSAVKNGFFDDPHNLFLYLGVAGGIPFLFLFLFLVGYPAWIGLSRLCRSNWSRHEDFSQSVKPVEDIALLGAVAVWLAAACFTPVAIPGYVMLAFLLSGLFLEGRYFSIPKINFLAASGKIFAVIIIVYGVCFLAAEHLFFASIKSYNGKQFSRSNRLAKVAIYLNPFNSLYYEYRVASAIRAGLPMEEVNKNIEAFSRFHRSRSYSYVQLANINYLLYYRTRSIDFKQPILENLNKAIDMDPYASNNYFLLAQYHYIFGDFGLAIEAVGKGLDLDTSAVTSRIFLAKIYQSLGNRDMFVQTLEEVFQQSDDKTQVASLLKLAKSAPNIHEIPFTVGFSVGRMD